MSSLCRVPVLIIGGGPAGLCSSYLLNKYGVDHILCESGGKLENRSQYKSNDITNGIGGAGLYSDGKFSFYPSATKLWELNEIQQSFDDIMDILTNYGINKNVINTLYQDNEINDDNNIINDSLQLKLYPSLYLDFNTRKRLINDFEINLNRYICTQTMVTNIIFNENTLKYDIYFNYDKTKYIETDYIIFSGGRYFPLYLNKQNNDYLGDSIFQRYEFGVRIEMNINSSFWNVFGFNGYNDPKYKFIDDDNENIEFRTFCYCKNGLVVKTNTFGINTFSGRADCKPTIKSNFGFNARIYDNNNNGYNHLIQQEISNWSINDHTFCETVCIGKDMHQIKDILTHKMGIETGEIITRGLHRLSAYFPALNQNKISLYGPTLEGVGKYPMLNALSWKSKHINNRLFCAGDCTGIFRGIVASMTSGNYAARQILECIKRTL